MDTMKLNRKILSHIKKLASPRIGRKGFIELGERQFHNPQTKQVYSITTLTDMSLGMMIMGTFLISLIGSMFCNMNLN